MSMTEASASFVKEALKDSSKIIVIDPKKEYKEIAKRLGGKLVITDMSKDRGGWFNPFTGESSYTEKLKRQADEAIKNKNYGKAYRLLGKLKKLQKQFWE